MLEVGIGVGWAYVETCRLRGVWLRLGGVGGEAYGRVAVIELDWVCSWQVELGCVGCGLVGLA